MTATRSSYGGSAGRASVPGTNQPDPARISGRAQVPGVAAPERAPARSAGYGGPGGPVYPGGRKPRLRPRWGRIALLAGIAVVVLGLLGGLGLWAYVNGLDDDLARTDPFSEITGGRPVKTVDGTLNILMVGSDSRDPDAPVDQGSEWRADTIILMHIPASHNKAYLVSVPRDLYVPIPENASAECGSEALPTSLSSVAASPTCTSTT